MRVRDSSLSPLKSLSIADASWAGPTFMKEKHLKRSLAIRCDWKISPVISWELEQILGSPGEVLFLMVKISKMGLVAEHRCVPGATVNGKSCFQICTAGPRRGFKTMQLDLFPQSFACLANILSLCSSFKEGGSKAGEMP